MTLPGVLFVGPLKTGTTLIDEYLRTRPEVCLPDGVKETFFFDRNCARGIEWYARHFRPGPETRVTVEVAPSLFSEAVAACPRIRYHLGDPLIVVTRREPVARSFSHYRHLYRYGLARGPLEKVAMEHPEILSASRYDGLLGLWRKTFSRVEILDFETIRTDPAGFEKRLCDLLGLAPNGSDLSQIKVNESAQPASFALARSSQMVADFLRRFRLYPVVNAAKSLGLKRLAFGGGGKGARPEPMTDAERRFLEEQLDVGPNA